MDKVFEKALTSVIRKQVMSNNSVTIEGLGTFKVEHVKQHASRTRKGQSVINPPRDVIVFTPGKE